MTVFSKNNFSLFSFTLLSGFSLFASVLASDAFALSISINNIQIVNTDTNTVLQTISAGSDTVNLPDLPAHYKLVVNPSAPAADISKINFQDSAGTTYLTTSPYIACSNVSGPACSFFAAAGVANLLLRAFDTTSTGGPLFNVRLNLTSVAPPSISSVQIINNSSGAVFQSLSAVSTVNLSNLPSSYSVVITPSSKNISKIDFQNSAVSGTAYLTTAPYVACSSASSGCPFLTKAGSFSLLARAFDSAGVGGALDNMSLKTIGPSANPSPVANGERVFPADANLINVQDFGATGKGTVDDTAAIQKAITASLNNVPAHTLNGQRIIYFPAGTYLVSSPLKWISSPTSASPSPSPSTGQWQAELTLQGENQATTIIKLKSNSPAYSSASSPLDVVDMGSLGAYGANGGGNNGFDNYIFDMTIDVGSGNPGAVALDFMGNNYCGIRNVTLQSSDPSHAGAVGLSAMRAYPGPCFIKNVTINGFNYGVELGNNEYSLTFENLVLQNQATYGILNDGNILSIENLTSDNTVPAIYNHEPQGLVTLVGAQLLGGASSSSAIENYGTLYARNVTTSGYASALSVDGKAVSGDSITEYTSGPVYTKFNGPSSSLGLALQSVPDFEETNLSQWTNVQTYGADPTGKKDSTAAIEAAIDAGTTTVYFPSGIYLVSGTISVHGAVRTLVGFDSVIQPSGSAFQSASSPLPLFRVDAGTSSSTDVTFDHFRIGIYNQNYFGLIAFEQNSNRPMFIRNTVVNSVREKQVPVVLSMVASYQNTSSGTGTTFLEDFSGIGVNILYPQSVYAWQLNPEGNTQKVLNKGGNLWILGLKTELAGGIIETDSSGSTELLGGLVYPVQDAPLGESAFVINDSQATFVYGLSNYASPSPDPACATGSLNADCETANFSYQVTETQAGSTKYLWSADVEGRTPYGTMMPLYSSQRN